MAGCPPGRGKQTLWRPGRPPSVSANHHLIVRTYGSIVIEAEERVHFDVPQEDLNHH